MTDTAVDLSEAELVLCKKCVGGRPQLGFDQTRDVAREDCFEPVIGDVPPHNVEAVRPSVLAGRDDRRTLAAAAQERGGRPVAKQRSRNDIAFREIVAAEGQCAQFDDEKQKSTALISS